MKWLITGGCGFIGTGLIANLLAEGGHSIRVLDNLLVGDREDLGKVCSFTEADSAGPGPMKDSGVELVVGDIRTADLTLRSVEGADIIVHLAANTGVEPSVNDPRLDCETNVIGVLNMLEAARMQGVGRFVFASSGAPLGEVVPPIHEEMAPHPVSPYGASKLAGEGYCSAYKRTFGVDTVALRFGNVYGQGSIHKSSVVAKFIKLALDGKDWEIYGSGRQTRDFIYLDDLLHALRLSATINNVGGEAFQIATARETTVLEMAEMLSEALVEAGIARPTIHHAEQRQGDVMRNYSDTSKADARLGWAAETALPEGLRRTVAFFTQRADQSTISDIQ